MIPGTHMIEESQIAVPLCYGARVIGVIAISKLGVDQFDEDDVRLLEVLAGHASVALENARLYEAQRREADHLKALLEFTGAISEAATPDAIGAETVRAAARLLGGKKCALWLPDENGDFRISAHADYEDDPSSAAMLGVALERQGDPRRRSATAPSRSCWASDEAERCAPPAPGLGWPELALAPLRTDGALEGFISRARADGRERAHGRRDPSPARRHLVPGGRRAGARAQLREPRGDVRLDGRGAGERARGQRRVHLLAHALDHRHGDAGRRGDGLRGRRAEAARARRALPRHRQDRDPDEHPAQAGPAHRRGAHDRSRCTRSSASGSSSRSSGSPRCARSSAAATSAGTAPATRTGKAGEEIPLEARIILVCDAFHAMTTDRPYRKRLSGEEACRRLREGAGTQFDPGVVDVFLSLPLRGADAARRHRRRATRPRSFPRTGQEPRAPASDGASAMRQSTILSCSFAPSARR